MLLLRIKQQWHKVTPFGIAKQAVMVQPAIAAPFAMLPKGSRGGWRWGLQAGGWMGVCVCVGGWSPGEIWRSLLSGERSRNVHANTKGTA